MDAMVALLDAGLSGLRSTPSPGDAHLSGEPSPVDARTNPVSTRLSYGPPTAVETPASAPSHAEPMPGSPATTVGAAGSTVGTVPMAHQADMVAAALALAAAATEKADLAATIRQMQQQMDYAAMVSENTQLRLERENTRLRHEAQLLAVTASAERDVARAQLAAAPDPPAMPTAGGAAPVAPAIDTVTMKLIMGQLVIHNPPAAMVANKLDDLDGVERVSAVVLQLLKGFHIISGGPSFSMTVAILFNLPDLHELVDTEDVAYVTAVAILHACAHHGHGHAEDVSFDDAASAVDSVAHGARRRDIFGGDHEARRAYQCLAHFVSGGDGGMPHPGMANWILMDKHAAGYLHAMLGDGPNHKHAMRQPTLIKIVHSLLLANKHSVGSRLLADFATVVNPARRILALQGR